MYILVTRTRGRVQYVRAGLKLARGRVLVSQTHFSSVTEHIGQIDLHFYGMHGT